ncbi:MAG: translocation/assembly module TamB domain-containing protein [Bacteroidales bacterium]
MLRILRYIRRFIVGSFAVLVIGYTLLYIILSLNSVQRRIADFAEREISSFLNTRVAIGEIRFYPFNKAVIKDMVLFDIAGDTLFYAKRAGLSLNLSELTARRLVFNTISIESFDIAIYKGSNNGETNIQFIIDKFSGRKSANPFDVRISTILLQGGTLKYDVKKEPDKGQGVFDKNHICFKNILINASIKAISRDSVNINLRSLRFNEKSGFSVKKLAFKLIGNKDKIQLVNFAFETGKSYILLKNSIANITGQIDKNNFANNAEINLGIKDGIIFLADFAQFIPSVKHFTTPVIVNCLISGVINHLNFESFSFIYGNDLISVTGYGNLDNIFPSPEKAFIFGKINKIKANPEGIITLTENLSVNIKDKTILHNLGNIGFSGEISGFVSKFVTYGNFNCAIGKIDADMLFDHDNGFKFSGRVKSDGIALNGLIPEKGLGNAGFELKLNGFKSSRYNKGEISGKIKYFEYRDYRYNDIAIDGSYLGTKYSGSVALNDSNITLLLDGEVDLSRKNRMLRMKIKGDDIRLNELMLTKKYEGSVMAFDIDANFTGTQFDTADGEIKINNFYFQNNGKLFSTDSAVIWAQNSVYPQTIDINSDILKGRVEGKYSFKTLKSSFISMLADVAPNLTEDIVHNKYDNNFTFDFNISNTVFLSEIFELPFSLDEKCSINGYYADKTERFSLSCDMPAFGLGNIDFKDAGLKMEKFGKAVQIEAQTTHITAKNVRTAWNINSITSSDSTTLKISWENEKPKVFSGEFLSATHFIKSAEGRMFDIVIHPSKFIINDSVWNISPATVFINRDNISLNDVEIGRAKQFLKIDGDFCNEADKTLEIGLKDIDLSYIFDILDKPNIVFGGKATGEITVKKLPGRIPEMYTNGLKVKDFSYNYCTFGDLNLSSQWEYEKKAILLNGIVSKPGAQDTKILGRVFPSGDSLHFAFNANKVGLTFLRPFTEKILTNVDGEASGLVNLYGKFKALNVSGAAYVKDFRFGIDYLNTGFSISDSVHLDTKGIWVNNAKLNDTEGNTGMVSMILKHQNFQNLSYNIGISKLNNFLAFNVTERLNPVYFGKIYVSGAGNIVGNNKYTLIDINMRTDAKSRFTYVLGNETSAGDYKFITYVDKNTIDEEMYISPDEKTTANTWQNNIAKHKLNLNLQIDATPNATMELIINPATNDRLKANGEGGIRIEYSNTDEMKIYGTYTAEKGNYNMNLQDLIAKEFIVNPGSSITFRGNPMNADLNISAYYGLQANLLDLDESFAQERDLNRTTVPVQTTMTLTGDLRRPDFRFDLNFPSLSQDIYRRVKSIINTEDMMNRQVLYLLALNKFYTPEYMNVGQTHSNELASVASSALSSQLNNILGQISDKFNIGTNFRSEKGDFSDIEFDVALSSQLLNNRLIFNGNLGYRDKSVNSNSFIGDFDLEYLINKAGTFRLKAYNHYNDKNYYVKSALTTQGVGLEIFQRTSPKRDKSKLKKQKIKVETKKIE